MRPFFGLVGLALLAATGGVACAPTELSPDQIVSAFIATSQDDARTFHMEWQGTIHTNQGEELGVTGSEISFNATFEFSGADYEGVLTTTFGGQGGSSTTSYAQVGGAYFTRSEFGEWQPIEPGGVTPLAFDPLAGLTAAGVTYEEPETIDGRPLHRLRVADPLGALQRTLLPANAFNEVEPIEGGASEYLVYLDAHGVPVEARLRVDVRMQTIIDHTGAGAEVEYGMTSTYVFSDWGAEITIVAPPITNSGGGGIDDKPPPPQP